MRLCMVTVEAPFGTEESCLHDELEALGHIEGIDLYVAPRKGTMGARVHGPEQDAYSLVRLVRPGARAWVDAVLMAARRPVALLGILRAVASSRSPVVAAKNLAVVPRAYLLARAVRLEEIECLHAHWGSTTSTLTMFASWLSGVPWSLTVHRWDITEDNLLGRKTADARFVRCIAESGRRMVAETVGERRGDVRVLHMGVRVDETPIVPVSQRDGTPENAVVFACPARLIPLKDHENLFRAVAILAGGGHHVRLRCFGDGPLRGRLEELVEELELDGQVVLEGSVPQWVLFRNYEEGEVDAVVMASVIEGISVSLMEAASRGIPCVATAVGGTVELLDQAGLLVPPRESEALAEAMARILDPAVRASVGRRGRLRVEEHFDADRAMTVLARWLGANPKH